jgi:radical S-adenosyl methionine domain-containing protein 2
MIGAQRKKHGKRLSWCLLKPIKEDRTFLRKADSFDQLKNIMAFMHSIVHSSFGLIAITLLALAFGLYLEIHHLRPSTKHVDCVSVNYHFTRKCNKTCKFCFHTEKSSHVATEEEMKRGLRLLKEAGMRKINFAGGEPFLYPKELRWLCQYCKEVLALESVSIISNGTKVNKKWLDKYGQFVDVMGVSCDSFDEETNELIGRGTGENVKQLFRIRDWCRKLNIKFKLNTVVCKLNWQDDMVSTIQELQPFRWKCFQVLFVEDENDASSADTALDKRKRDARDLLITTEQWQTFCEKHQHLDAFVPESNDLMASSYLILDEYMCFLDKGKGKVKQSKSILEVGVARALEEVYFDKAAFLRRGGEYNWSKGTQAGFGAKVLEQLEW